MKSLSIKGLTRGQSFRFLDCFSPNASVNSIMYSRCLLYIVLLISLVNLFYIINMQQAYALVIFFLVGFITSFFIKNMIVILLFATFVSLFFQSTQYKIAGRETFENQEEGVEEKEGGDATPAPVKESLSDETSNEEEVDLTNAQVDSEAPTVTKAAKLKKDMKDYFAVQEKLLDVLEKAEPLQKEAMAIKERFNEKAKKTK